MTPLEIAQEIREQLKKGDFAVVTVPNRRDMDRVLEHLSHEEAARTRFRFYR